MGPSNGIVGDSFGLDLPESVMDEQSLNEEKKMARYSKSKEFKRLKEYMEARINFYQKYLPDGRPVAATDNVTAEDWRVANTVISEFKNVIDQYELAADVVKRAETNV